MKKLDKIWPSFLFQTHFAGDLYTSSKKLSTTYYTFVINEWSIQHQQKKSPQKSFQKNFTSFQTLWTLLGFPRWRNSEDAMPWLTSL